MFEKDFLKEKVIKRKYKKISDNYVIIRDYNHKTYKFKASIQVKFKDQDICAN